MFCSNCGAKVADNVKFCPYCGTPIQQTIPNTQPSQLPIYTHQGNSFIDQIKGRLTNSKIVILILSALSFIFIFAIPYVNVYKSSNSYPIWLTGGNDMPSFLDGDFDAGFTAVLLLFMAALITMVISLILEKKTLCMIAAIADVAIAFLGFSLVMGMIQDAQSSSSKVACTPIGALLQIGLAIAMLVMIIKENSKKQTNQGNAFIFK